MHPLYVELRLFGARKRWRLGVVEATRVLARRAQVVTANAELGTGPPVPEVRENQVGLFEG